MGECGCGNFQPRASFKVGKRVVSVEIYPGCETCRRYMEAVVYVFPNVEEFKSWNISDLVNLDSVNSVGVCGIPLFGRDDLIEALKEIPEAKEYDDFADFLHDYGLELLQTALSIRRSKKG
jgi:hypothetical protein